MASPRTSAFAAARRPVPPCLAARESPGAHVLGFLQRMGRSADGVAPIPSTVRRCYRRFLPSALLFRSTGGGRIPPGDCPSPGRSRHGWRSLGASLLFLVHEAESGFPLGGPAKSGPSRSRGDSIPRDPATPLLTSFTSRQGRVSAVASLVPDKEPLAASSPGHPRGGNPFASRLRYASLPAGGAFPRSPRSSRSDSLRFFRSSGPFWPCSQGASCAPRTLLRQGGRRGFVDLATHRSPRNT